MLGEIVNVSKRIGGKFIQSKELLTVIFFLVVFVISSLIENITNFYGVKLEILRSYFAWITMVLFLVIVLPLESSSLYK